MSPELRLALMNVYKQKLFDDTVMMDCLETNYRMGVYYFKLYLPASPLHMYSAFFDEVVVDMDKKELTVINKKYDYYSVNKII